MDRLPPRLLGLGALAFMLIYALQMWPERRLALRIQLEEVQPEPDSEREGWAATHAAFAEEVAAARAEKSIDIILYGDSNTESFRGTFLGHDYPRFSKNKQAWQELMGDKRALALGISGDRAPHLLWRLQNGEGPAGINPQTATVMVGTNDVGHLSKAHPGDTELVVRTIVAGVRQCVQELQRQAPKARVIVFAVLPMQLGDLPGSLFGKAIRRINQQLQEFAQQQSSKRVQFADCGGGLLESNGRLSKKLVPDGIHPTGPGAKVLMSCIAEAIDSR